MLQVGTKRALKLLRINIKESLQTDMENVFWTRYNPNKTKKIEYQVKIETKDELQERIKQLDTKFEVKDNEEKKYYTIDKNVKDERYKIHVSYRKRTKEEAQLEINT